MFNSVFKEKLIDTYYDVMKSYLESDNVKESSLEWNKWYSSFRKRLAPEYRQEFDDLVHSDEEMNQALAEEAFYRGAMLVITEHNNYLKG